MTKHKISAAVSALSFAFLLPAYTQAQTSMLEEVIVTAQKREQSLQEVPISLEVFSAQRIDNLGAQDIADLAAFTANVNVSRASNQPSYRIRGIGTSDFGIGADPAVGVYFDGVYIGRSGGSKVAFNDIARVEVLNGPQGTLFGRNAAAGAIQYVANKAEQERYGWIRLTGGNYKRRQIDGVFNTGLTDTLALRAGLLINKRDGYVKNLLTSKDMARENNQSANVQLRWQPDSNLDVIWRVEYDHVDADSRPSSSVTLGPRDNGAAFTRVVSDEVFEEKRELWGTSLHLTWNLPFATLTSITSHREYKTRNPEEKDGAADPYFRLADLNAENNRAFQQELRLSGDWGSKLVWTTGINYFYEHARQQSGIMANTQTIDRLIAEREIKQPYSALPPGQAFDIAFLVTPDLHGTRRYKTGAEALAAGSFTENIFINAKYHSYAAFADVSYDLTDAVTLTAGLRYTRDDKEFGRYVAFNDFALALAFTTETRIDAAGNYDPNGQLGWLVAEDDWSKFTPRVVIDWQFSSEMLLYASYSEGYKAGGFNSAGELFAPAIEPEDMTNYEIGMKSSWLDDRLRVNGAVFFYEYDNLQALEFRAGECLPNSNLGTYLFATSDIEGFGAEISANWLVLPELELFFNAGTLDAEYSRRNEYRVVNNQCRVINRAGETYSNLDAPPFSFSLGGNYRWGLKSGAELMASLSYSFSQGAKRDECSYVVPQSNGTSAHYKLAKVDGVLQLVRDSSVAPLGSSPLSRCPDYDDMVMLNGRVGWTSPSQQWEVAAWITNATDWEPDVNPGGIGGELASVITDGSPAYDRRDEPRMYGLLLRYNFQ